MSVIAATQHYKLSGRMKAIVGNIDTKIFLKPTSNSETAVLKYLNTPRLKSEYLQGMQRGDCIISAKLYDQTIDMNRYGVVLGRILDFQLDSPLSASHQQESEKTKHCNHNIDYIDTPFSTGSFIDDNQSL